MYAEGWHILGKVVPYAALAVFGEYGVQVLKEIEIIELPTAFTVFVPLLIWSILAYAAHAEILLPAGRDKSEDGVRYIGFTVRTVLLTLIGIVPYFSLAFYLADVLPSRHSAEVQLNTLFLVLLPVLGLFCFLVYSLAGTILPAYVANRADDKGVGFGAAKRQFFWIFGRLLIGPGVVFSVSVGLFIVPNVYFGLSGDFISSTGFPDLATSGLGILTYTVQAYATVLAAVVLSRAYLREVGVPSAT